MPPLGRPALARGVFPLDDLRLDVPREVVLDTSFVVEALIESQPAHLVCAQFLLELVFADATLYFNRLLELELAETAFKIALRERHADFKRARSDGRARRRAGRLMEEARRAWDEVLSAFPHARIEIEEVAEAVPALMTAHGLASYDAVHAATADRVGVRSIVTLDSGFALLPLRYTLFTTSGRLRRFRALRPQRA